MSPLASKALLVGIPLLISLAWFLFWVLRITAAARKIKAASIREKQAAGARATGAGGPSDSSEAAPREAKD